jgi:hypothetical protein
MKAGMRPQGVGDHALRRNAGGGSGTASSP